MAESKQSPEGMKQFAYKAIERATGRTRTGEMAGVDAYAVRASLRHIGLDVEKLSPLQETTVPLWLKPIQHWWISRQRHRRRLARGELLEAVATLLDAGLPLEQALGTLLVSQARRKDERQMLRRVRDRLRQGMAFDEACAYHPDWFDTIDTALMSAGQQSGDLAAVLRSLSVFHQRGAALGHKVIMALAYPCLLLVAGLAVVAFIATGTLPQLVQVLTDSGRAVPMLTELVMLFGQIMTNFGIFILIGGVAVFLFVQGALAKVSPKSWLGKWLSGNLLARTKARIRIAQLAETLSGLLHNGLPLTESLEVVAATTSQTHLKTFFQQAAEAVKRGDDLSTQAAESHLLDPEFAQLLKLGEQSGELADMLDRISERYRRTAERSTDRLTALLEPAAILFLALLIGIVVVAAALPLAALGDIL